MPGLFVAQGLVEVEVYVNDKTTPVFPPYRARGQHAFAEDVRDRVARRLCNNGSEADTRRLYLAGGGLEHDFAVHFARALASLERIVHGLNDSTYHGVSGGAFFFVAGRKTGRETTA